MITGARAELLRAALDNLYDKCGLSVTHRLIDLGLRSRQLTERIRPMS